MHTCALVGRYPLEAILGFFSLTGIGVFSCFYVFRVFRVFGTFYIKGYFRAVLAYQGTPCDIPRAYLNIGSLRSLLWVGSHVHPVCTISGTAYYTYAYTRLVEYLKQGTVVHTTEPFR